MFHFDFVFFVVVEKVVSELRVIKLFDDTQKKWMVCLDSVLSQRQEKNKTGTVHFKVASFKMILQNQ